MSRAEGCTASSSLIEVIKIAASVGIAQKEKEALDRNSTLTICDMEKMCTKLDGARLAVHVPEVREK